MINDYVIDWHEQGETRVGFVLDTVVLSVPPDGEQEVFLVVAGVLPKKILLIGLDEVTNWYFEGEDE